MTYPVPTQPTAALRQVVAAPRPTTLSPTQQSYVDALYQQFVAVKHDATLSEEAYNQNYAGTALDTMRQSLPHVFRLEAQLIQSRKNNAYDYQAYADLAQLKVFWHDEKSLKEFFNDTCYAVFYPQAAHHAVQVPPQQHIQLFAAESAKSLKTLIEFDKRHLRLTI